MCHLKIKIKLEIKAPICLTELSHAVTAENSQEDEKREDEYFQKMYQQWKGVKAKDDSTYKVIPKFYFKVLLVSCVFK